MNKLNRRRFVRQAAAATGAVAASLYAPTIIKAAPTGRWADLVGRIALDGDRPVRKKLKVDKDLDCCGKFDIRDESLMVGEDFGLANIFVYVRTKKVDVCPELEESAEQEVLLDNRDCIFQPHCMTIWQGKQKLRIVNSDPVAQNVAFSPLGDARANLVLGSPPAKGCKATWSFRRQQNLPVPIACNYHPWESAFILPRGNPYVATTGTDGTFRIAKLPVGKKLEFQVWQERVGRVQTGAWKKGRFKLTIKPGTNDLGTIQLPAALFEKKS